MKHLDKLKEEMQYPEGIDAFRVDLFLRDYWMLCTKHRIAISLVIDTQSGLIDLELIDNPKNLLNQSIEQLRQIGFGSNDRKEKTETEEKPIETTKI